MIFTKSQEKVINEGVNWFLNSSEQIFEIDGEAGTGKSVTLFEIIKRLGLHPSQYMPMAYTGQASIIMRTKGFPHAKSVHSSLYHVVKVEKEIALDPFRAINMQFDTPVYTFEFQELPIGGISPDVKLFVIDEGYMIPRTMRDAILKHGVKVLVAGDSGQLPPIAGEAAFLTGYNTHRLTELMRQAADNPIIYIAHRARYNEPIHCGLYGDKVLVINDSEMTDNMILNIGNIICGTNKSRDYFNNRTRELMNIRSKVPLYGERIICRNNNWNIEQDNIALANGLAGVVASPYGINSFDGDTILIDFLPDLCRVPFSGLHVDYEYLISPYDIRTSLKNNHMRNSGELFEFAYALTTHLSQGAEFPAGIYYEEFLRSNIQQQLNYTGITRFKQYLIYVKKTKKLY